MSTTKAGVDQGLYSEPGFQEATTLEQQANSTYNAGNFVRAKELYKDAEQIYSEVARTLVEIGITGREIQSFIDKYKTFFENGDIQALKSLLNWTGKQVESWSDFFSRAENIQVTIERKNLQITGNKAKLDLLVKFKYYNKSNNSDAKGEILETWRLEKIDDNVVLK